LFCSFADKTEYVVTTPPVNETKRHLAIKLELKIGPLIDTNYTFEYRNNSVFTGISPLHHLTV